ncbi:MAG: hypothetical protein ACJAZM_003032 [Cyclobacteriaceae bacterium]|jgi:hypothetical protein
MEINNEAYLNFLGTWANVMWILFFVALATSIAIFLLYKIKYWSTKDLKQKFDLASQSEIGMLQTSQYILAAAFFFIINTQKNDTVAISGIWFGIRIFLGLAIGLLHGYIMYLVFKYWYPRPLSKKLEKLRYSPRINSKTGNKMKLLSEAEEDAYLDEGMQAEENVFSVDYDVWIDPQTGETKIEKYQGHLTAHECDRCGFQTLRLAKEEVIQEATEFYDGELKQEYNCSYCGRIKRKTVKLSKKMDNDFSNREMIDDPLTHDKRIAMIKLDFHTKDGETKNFEFQSISQVQHFLEEFTFEKLKE